MRIVKPFENIKRGFCTKPRGLHFHVSYIFVLSGTVGLTVQHLQERKQIQQKGGKMETVSPMAIS